MASKMFLGIIIFISLTMCHSEERKCVCNDSCEGRGLTEIPQCLHRSIKEILVARNNISQIDPFSLLMYDSLESIDISYNKLTTLENETFVFVPKVTRITLRRNLIESVSVDLLKPLPKLEMLSVSENSIEEVSENMFDRNVNLKSLYLYRNKLRHIGKNLFRNLRKLQRLNFSNNLISSLHVETFSGNPSLKELFMAYNRIDHLDDRLFEHNGKLEYLDISGNDLVVLEAGIFKLNPKLATVVMSDNPWNCNCLMKTTLMDLSGRNIELDNVGKCWTPEGIGDLSSLLKMNISCQINEAKPHFIREQDSDKFQFCDDDTNYTMVIVGGFIIILAQIMICFFFSFYRYVVPRKTEDGRMNNSLKRKSANCYSYEIPINVTNKHISHQNDYNYIVPTASENVYACISETDNKYLTMIGYERIRPPPPPPLPPSQKQAEDVYTVMKSQDVNLDNKYLTLDGKFMKYENVS